MTDAYVALTLFVVSSAKQHRTIVEGKLINVYEGGKKMTLQELLAVSTNDVTATISEENGGVICILNSKYYSRLNDTILGYEVVGFSADRTNGLAISVDDSSTTTTTSDEG